MKEKNNKFKEKKDVVEKIIFNLDLVYTTEDKKNIQKLINSYFRKKKLYVNSKVEFIAGGLLWIYSRINFLFENDNNWSQKEIANKLNIKSKSISRTASSIMKHMKIDLFDKRFARKEIAKRDPRDQFFMTKEGFIVTKDQIQEIVLNKMREKYGDVLDFEPDEKIEFIDSDDKKNVNSNDNKNRKLTDF